MDPTKDAACSENEIEEETEKSHHCCSDPSSSFSNEHVKGQPRIQLGFSRFEWLALIIMALATIWICGLPPSDPMDWFQWLFYRNEPWTSPVRAALLFMAFLFFLIGNAYKRQMNRDVYSGSVKLNGVSILALSPGSIAEKASMRKGDVIIEYASEKDLTIEKLSSLAARKGPEAGQVCVVFLRDRKQYSQTLPRGPLGISAMNTTTNVLVKSE